jgi:group I intron endonuclease
MRTTTSLMGYNHTDEAKLKMLKRLKDKYNHPMYGKIHTDAVRKLISKYGKLNPMFGKHHSDTTKIIISDKLSKYPKG